MSLNKKTASAKETHCPNPTVKIRKRGGNVSSSSYEDDIIVLEPTKKPVRTAKPKRARVASKSNRVDPKLLAYMNERIKAIQEKDKILLDRLTAYTAQIELDFRSMQQNVQNFGIITEMLKNYVQEWADLVDVNLKR